MKLKSAILILILLSLFQNCNILGPKDDDGISVSFTVRNTLLWHISHEYKVIGTDAKGKDFSSDELEISYTGYLLEGQEIKDGSKLKLYRDGNLLWTSGAIKKSCSIIYEDSAFEDEVTIK